MKLFNPNKKFKEPEAIEKLERYLLEHKMYDDYYPVSINDKTLGLCKYPKKENLYSDDYYHRKNLPIPVLKTILLNLK